jgi:hypothetical protein
MSSTSPTRWAGMDAAVSRYNCSRLVLLIEAHSGDRITPGQTALTRMGASSTASARVSDSTAPQMLAATAQLIQDFAAIAADHLPVASPAEPDRVSPSGT